MANNKFKKILLSGGGTGGHIYPALAVAQEYRTKYPGIDIRFVGSERGLESKLIPDKGYKLYLLKIGPLHSSVGRMQQIKTLLLLPFVLLQCLWILIKFRPQNVIGFGGYASGPIVFMASLLFFKTAIWEANVQPGIANKILSKFVSLCFVVFEESLKFFPTKKTKCLGYPVRADFDVLYQKRNEQNSSVLEKANSAIAESKTEIVNSDSSSLDHSLSDTAKSDTAKSDFEKLDKLRVLIFGGSQGARIFNELIPKVAPVFPHLEFHLQTGLKNYDKTVQSLSKPIDNLKIYPFLDPILDFYLKSDLVICRSGAGALAELAAIGSNCLFVPFALASDNHQYKNALALSQRKAADLIEEKVFNEVTLTKFLNDFQAKSLDERRQISQRMLAFFKPKATANIVKEMVL
jgi:UDP-N-acetylglucosamine--N-acetylmuramyl-(pentapeptide) pyrophosphoryl-undecaprenol N-acetylglucosamine transferase